MRPQAESDARGAAPCHTVRCRTFSPPTGGFELKSDAPPRATVYRFRRVAVDRVLSPAHMWGTREAIDRLPDSTVIEDSAREVDMDRLEDGFYFESATPRTVDVNIDSEPAAPWK